MILLMALALVCAGAFLPGMVAEIQDRGTVGRVQYGDTPSVALDIRENTPAIGKLALMNHINGSINIPDTMASMTCEEAEEAAYAILQTCIDAGFLESFEVFSTEVGCMMGYVVEDPEWNAVIWGVQIQGELQGGYFMADLILDDETAKALYVGCHYEEPTAESGQEALLAAFAEAYFNALGISDYEDFATRDLEEQYTGDNACAVRYRFGDAVYGEVNVDLYVYTSGFYMEFPDIP